MALGKWTSEKQKDLFVAASDMPRSPGHPFYVALNKLLAEAKFDAYVEELCEPLYREGGRPGCPPGVFFRMLFVGYFEGIDSQRGIAWRCSDSMSLRSFLGLLPTESSPEHSSLTVIRKRMPNELPRARPARLPRSTPHGRHSAYSSPHRSSPKAAPTFGALTRCAPERACLRTLHYCTKHE